MRTWGPLEIDEDFASGVLDAEVWLPAYLPAWSSQAASAATYSVGPDGLHLSIPPEQPLWCPDQHDGPLRVSAIQSGNWSGPLGSTQGQQPFREGLRVREPQSAQWGFTPHYGRVEVECRATVTERSMFSAWLVGLEDEPEHSGEICLIEVFGATIEHVEAAGESGVRAALGSGIHPFRDPRLVEDFSAVPTEIDVSVHHRYAVDWRPDRVDFFVDGVPTRTAAQAPRYPMQLIIGVFDFPDRGEPGAAVPVPEVVVRRVTGQTLT